MPIAEPIIDSTPAVETHARVGTPAVQPRIVAAQVADTPAAGEKPAAGAAPIVVAKPGVAARPMEGAAPAVGARPVLAAMPIAEPSIIAEPVVVKSAMKLPDVEVQNAPEMIMLHAAPISDFVLPAPAAPAMPESVQQLAASTARTETIVETVNQIVETVVDEISVSSTLATGNDEIKITLRPTVLDGSTIKLSAKDGELTVAVIPATLESASVAAAALLRLEYALAAHAPAFNHVAVVLHSAKKGKPDETA